MSLNIELVLLATMADRGDFRPITGGTVNRENLLTVEAQTVYDFIVAYRQGTGGSAKYPALSVIKSRFATSGIPLPEPDKGANLSSLVHEVHLQGVRARWRELSTTFDLMAQSPDPMDGLTDIMRSIRDTYRSTAGDRHLNLAKALPEITKDYREGNVLPNGIPWPWESLTAATRGAHRKEYTVFAGRPKSRKTFIALRACTHMLVESGLRVLVLSPEMPPRQMLLRIVASMAGIRYQEFKDGTLDPAEEELLLSVADVYGMLGNEDPQHHELRMREMFHVPVGHPVPSIDIVQSAGKSNLWIASQIEHYEPDVVFVDSLYRHGGDVSSKSTETQRVASISRALKEMAMDYNVVLLTTHQINRDGDQKVGNLSNIALSDAVGQDLDVGLRVVTGAIEGRDHSALVLIGARETKSRGILIHNEVYNDMSEVGALTNLKVVEHLLKQEDEADAEEERKQASAAKKQGRKPTEVRESWRNKLTSKSGNAILKGMRSQAAMNIQNEEEEDAVDP